MLKPVRIQLKSATVILLLLLCYTLNSQIAFIFFFTLILVDFDLSTLLRTERVTRKY